MKAERVSVAPFPWKNHFVEPLALVRGLSVVALELAFAVVEDWNVREPDVMVTTAAADHSAHVTAVHC